MRDEAHRVFQKVPKLFRPSLSHFELLPLITCVAEVETNQGLVASKSTEQYRSALGLDVVAAEA